MWRERQTEGGRRGRREEKEGEHLRIAQMRKASYYKINKIMSKVVYVSKQRHRIIAAIPVIPVVEPTFVFKPFVQSSYMN